MFKILIILDKFKIRQVEISHDLNNMLGFTDEFLYKDINISTISSNIDRIKYLRIYCNIVDNQNEEYLLDTIFINSPIAENTIYKNDSVLKSLPVINSQFEDIIITIRDQDDNILKLQDFFSCNIYIK